MCQQLIMWYSTWPPKEPQLEDMLSVPSFLAITKRCYTSHNKSNSSILPERQKKKAAKEKLLFELIDSGPAASITVRRPKLLYILHKLLYFIHDGRFLNQLWVEVCEVVIHVSETIDKKRYTSIFLLGFLPTVIYPIFWLTRISPTTNLPYYFFFFFNKSSTQFKTGKKFQGIEKHRL